MVKSAVSRKQQASGDMQMSIDSNAKNCIKKCQCQSGQAMVEILIAATFILVPLFFLIPYLGKVGDMQHRAYEGARYVAWETAITNKTQEQIQNELPRRILYAEHTELDSEEDRESIGVEEEQIDNLYHHTNDDGTYERYIDNPDDQYADSTLTNSSPDSVAFNSRQALLTNRLVAFNLNDNGLINAEVAFTTMQTRHFTLNQPVTPTANNAMYIEAWRQVNHGQLTNAIQDSISGERLFDNGAFRAAATAGSALGFREWGDFEPGFIQRDIVPCSRVVDGGSDRESAC